MWRTAQNTARKTDGKKSWFSSFLWWFVIFTAAWWMIGVFMRPTTKSTDVETSAPAAIDVSAVPVQNIASQKVSYDVRGLRVNNFMLNDFSDSVTLLPAGDDAYMEIGFVSQNTTVPTAATVWRTPTSNQLTWRNNVGVEFSRTISDDDYLITVTDTIKNNTSAPIAIAPYVHIMRPSHKGTSSGVYTGAIAYANSDVEHHDWRSLDKKSYAYTTTNGFVGFADQYWETVASIDAPDQTIRMKKSGEMYSADAAAGAVVVNPGDEKTIRTNIFAGPRDQAALNAASKTITGINKTVDYGWFWFLARPMLWLLNAINAMVMNYGIAIIIMTLLLRVLMWPLTRKSYVSMAAMQKMQPEMARIQKLYANNKMRLQMEMMRLYRTHKTSPMSGCLPMLIQIPIFFALYKALLISVPMRGAHFLWIHDLAAMDPYFILPILMGATMWVQMRLQSPANKSANGAASDVAAHSMRVMKWMPVVFTVLFAWMPAGLVLYWTVSNVFGLVQMYVIRRRMDK